MRLAPMLFNDHDRGAPPPNGNRSSPRPTVPGPRSASDRPPDDDDLPVHSFRILLSDLATLYLNKVSLPSNPKYRFELPTSPRPSRPAPSNCSASAYAM